MSFKTLAERFEATSREIYTRFPNPSNIEGNPLLSTTAEKNLLINDSRLFPIVSSARHTIRVSRFLGTGRGVTFAAIQALLQTKNTFADTRLWNPLSLYTFPFSLTRRHIPGFAFVPGQDQTNRGLLQQETINKFSAPPQTIRQLGTQLIKGVLDNVVSRVITPITAAAISNQGRDFNTLPRPEYKIYGGNTPNLNPAVPALQPISTRGSQKPLVSDVARDPMFGPLVWNVVTKQFLDKQAKTDTNERMVSSPYLDEYQPATADRIQGLVRPVTAGITRLKDSMNERSPFRALQDSADLFINQVTYKSIEGNDKTDIIPFVFRLVGGEPVQFRAFISEIKQDTSTEFSEQRYIGRNERFVTYGGSKRSLKLMFTIAALSKDEIDNMWLRMNYLNGLAFPRSVSTSGFMTPPLLYITVGRIFNEQPCYITAMDFEMLDDTITFDVDAKVSQAIVVNMSISILEKRTKMFDSPFYKITEDLQGSAIRPPVEASPSETAAPDVPEVDINGVNRTSNGEAYKLPPWVTTAPATGSFSFEDTGFRNTGGLLGRP